MSKVVISDKKIKFEITETDNEIIVDASVPKREVASEPKIRCTANDVSKILNEEGIEYLEVKQGKNQMLTNSINQNLDGRWIFEKPKSKPKRNSTRKSIRTRTKAIAEEKREKGSIEGKDKLLGTEAVE